MRAPPETSRKAEALAALGAEGVGRHIVNLQTTVEVLETTAGLLPMTRNNGATPTCYLCCPSVAYLDYARAELRHFARQPALYRALSGLLGLARGPLRLSGFDRQVQPNNWLLATNPVPALAPDELAAITARLVARFPDHAMVWRSLNAVSDTDRIAAFRAAGYALLPARQVYLFDCRTSPPHRHRDERRDGELLARGDYRQVGQGAIGAADFERMATLYARLYLDKYTGLNPAYTARFIATAHGAGLLEFGGLRNAEGRLDGVIGFFDLGDTMTVPLLGYDTGLPAETGLYRRLMAMALGRARDRKMLFNMSAGAAGFKRNRGGVPGLEYNAIYTRHLPWHRRAGGWIVRAILETVGVPLIRRFAL